MGGGEYCSLAQMKRTKSKQKICLTCNDDIKTLEKDILLFDGIYTNEFILSGLVQQQLDGEKFSMKDILYNSSVSKRKGTTKSSRSSKRSKRK